MPKLRKDQLGRCCRLGRSHFAVKKLEIAEEVKKLEIAEEVKETERSKIIKKIRKEYKEINQMINA
jgi:hypothetical protein